jgi:hypothetical protein
MQANPSSLGLAGQGIGGAEAMRSELDGLNNLHIASAPAQVAREGLYNFRSARQIRSGEERVSGQNHTGRAKAALQTVGFAKRILKDAHLARAGRDTLDGEDVVAVGLDGQDQARTDWHAIQQHGASTTDPVLAARVRAAQSYDIAQAVEQRASWLYVQMPALTVNP